MPRFIWAYGRNLRGRFGVVDILSKESSDLFVLGLSHRYGSYRRGLSFSKRCYRWRLRWRINRLDDNCTLADTRTS